MANAQLIYSVPDVAAQAENFYLRWKGAWYLVGGTSAASPTFASVISLLDDELVAAGKAPLGFLNPLIYSNSQAFTDITSGSFHLYPLKSMYQLTKPPL